MVETFDFIAYFRAMRELREATNRVLGISFEMLAADAAGVDFSSSADLTAYALVSFDHGRLRYEPISAEEFYANADEGRTA